MKQWNSPAWRPLSLLMLAAHVGLAAGVAQAASTVENPRQSWDFKFKDFVIGAWWGPGATDAEMKLYKEAGFNVVMSGRYMQLDDYGDPKKGLEELDLARKHGLAVMFDTYTKNNRPWGGKVGPTDSHPLHHPASLAELQWLYQRLGHHPALIGFMIGDDQGTISTRSADCTRFLHQQPKPQLMPWLCGWIAPKNLADHGNPIMDPQIYPTLYSWGQPAQELARQYCANYAGISRQCRDLGLLFWPMFNTTSDSFGKTGKDAFGYCPSDSLVRFPAYAALAYGAEGIWYFTYNGGALQHLGEYHTEEEARKALTPLYPVARRINQRIAAWGPHVLGRKSTGLFGSAFLPRTPPETRWPFPEDRLSVPTPEALAPPHQGKLVEEMTGDLLVGILTRPGKAPLAMVVDCRTSKNFGDLPSRSAMVRFTPEVTRVNLLEGKESRPGLGNIISLNLEPGGGQMLELHGKGLDALCSTEAIYAATKEAPTPQRKLTESDLAGIQAARLRIDLFGSDGQPAYNQKFIYLNGRQLARVPANNADNWTLETVELTPEQLGWIRKSNEVSVRIECEDSWKFRNLTLAVQLADGTWVKTGSDTTTFSTPGWAYGEGKNWGKDGVAGPVNLEFK